MIAKITPAEAQTRRINVLDAARWCFLNFGFAKTSLDDIAKRANISRTLIYRMFKDKAEIFRAVFEHWLMADLPLARAAAGRAGDPYDRLVEVCRIVAEKPYSVMFGAPMAGEFFDACEKIDQAVSKAHRRAALACIAEILGDAFTANVFVLSLDGLLADDPTPATLSKRVQVLAARFTTGNVTR